MTLRSYERGWMCQVCGTYNEPDYDYCQECLHDIDGTPPPKDDEE